MKFDFCIGNPPYQESRDNTKDIPVYNYFLDAAITVADKVEMIHPARFLFNAGATPKEWNQKKLNDTHFKVLEYEANSRKVFSSADIKGGVAITYQDKDKDFGSIGTFSNYEELNSIRIKVNCISSLTDIMVLQLKFNLEVLYRDYPDLVNFIGSNGKERRLTSNIFSRVYLFKNKRTSDDDIEILGIENNERTKKFLPKKYIDMSHKSLSKWKVLIPKSNGSGAIGEVLSTPLIGEPLIGYTFSFIGVGTFDTRTEAVNCLKYIKTKFARTMLGILKITQDNLPEKWRYVPLQDFTDKSDIDWTKSVHEIDLQLYRKYGLSDEEIRFIEEKVKVME